MKQRSYVVLLVFMIFIGGLPVYTHAESSVMGALTATPDGTRALFFNDVQWRGTSSRFDSFIEIGKGLRSEEGSVLDLQYVVSPHLLKAHSSLTVFLNDLPISTISLDPSGPTNKNWRIDLSAHSLTAGFHKISFVAQMRTRDDSVCEDPNNEKLWITASDTSAVYLNLSPIYEQPDLSWYPSPFISKGSPYPLHAVIVVPDEINEDEFAAAAELSQYIVSQTPGNRLSVPIFTESDLTNAILQELHVIWIGEQGRWKGAGKQAAQAARKVASNLDVSLGAIVLTPSPWNENRSHLFLMGKGKQLLNGAEILTDAVLMEQMQGTAILIGEKPKAMNTLAVVDEGRLTDRTTLGELGYTNLNVRNVRQGTLQFSYTLPVNRVLAGAAQLELTFSHSKAISLNQSAVSVFVNGTPAESMRLSKQTADSGTLNVRIDPTIIGNGRNINIEVVFQFAKDKYESRSDYWYPCIEYLDENWAIIDENSTFLIPMGERSTLDLDSLPFPFVGQTAWERTVLLAPKWGTKELQLAMTFIGHLGAANPDVGNIVPRTTASPDWKSEAQQAHVMYFGTANSLPKELNGYEGSFFRVEGNRITNLSEHVQLLYSRLDDFAFVQLTASPLAVSKALIILTGSSDRRLAQMTTTIADQEQSFHWRGRIIALDPDGKVVNFASTVVVVPTMQSVDTDVNERWSSFSIGVTGFLIVTFVVLAMLLQLFWYLRKKQ